VSNRHAERNSAECFIKREFMISRLHAPLNWSLRAESNLNWHFSLIDTNPFEIWDWMPWEEPCRSIVHI
jgi:hypothetical protein